MFSFPANNILMVFFISTYYVLYNIEVVNLFKFITYEKAAYGIATVAGGNSKANLLSLFLILEMILPEFDFIKSTKHLIQ